MAKNGCGLRILGNASRYEQMGQGELIMQLEPLQ